MTVSTTEVVWYTSYGSNISAERFAVYLTGGQARGSVRSHPGSRDSTPPRHAEHCTIQGGLYFAGVSRTWGGRGAAFFDPNVDGEVWAKRYLVTAQQFGDVLAQETGRTDAPIDLAALRSDGEHVLGTNRYDRVLHLGDLDDVPLVTFTSPTARADLNPPSIAYRSTIAGGLHDRPNTSTQDIGRYLDGWPPTTSGSVS